jgi:hypothetical protein
MTNQQLLERAMELAIAAPTDEQYNRAMRLVSDITREMHDREVEAAIQATRQKIRSSWKK